MLTERPGSAAFEVQDPNVSPSVPGTPNALKPNTRETPEFLLQMQQTASRLVAEKSGLGTLEEDGHASADEQSCLAQSEQASDQASEQSENQDVMSLASSKKDVSVYSGASIVEEVSPALLRR